jgi:fatty acid desaturase
MNEHQDKLAAECPRETMRVLPRWLQPFLTWLTGMPLSDQVPLFRSTPIIRAAGATAVTLSGVTLGVFALQSRWTYVLVPVSWLLTCSGMRDLYANIEHFCIHKRFVSSHLVNRIVGEIISLVVFAAPYDLFRRDHLTHHFTTRTDRDPDVHFLTGTGFHCGMSRKEFRRYILRTSLSPTYHLKYLYSRLVANFTAPFYRTVMTIVCASGLAIALMATEAHVLWLVLWAFPAVVPFQIASLINFHSEHRWVPNPGRGKAATARVCVGRFSGDAVPQFPPSATTLQRTGQWVRWWTRVVFVHLPYRLFILVGDQSQHDLHHRRPSADWANAAYTRRDDIAAGCPGWELGYQDLWGTLVDHLDECIIEQPAFGHIVRGAREELRPVARSIA